ncbi:hypothetical protein [Clostridium sp. E02]|uniref:hypothetical protein n=1 Tax=Clostridium sp. E02 TaxID=2487134 RepID=UPI000F543C22|nr:hypothetical protein [Clostridium sp. E02]
MDRKAFFKSKEGALTISFVVIMVAFMIEVFGLSMNSDKIYIAGFLAILAAILYSPVGVYILRKW